MSALDVLRQIKLARKAQGPKKIVEWGNAECINEIGVENLSRRDLRNHLEARDLDTIGTRLELIERLRTSIADEQLHKFAYKETIDTEFMIQADLEERGSVYVIGCNNKGQLGLGDTEPRRFFSVIPQLRGRNTCNIVAGDDMVFVVTEDHDVFVWGGGGVGRNGINPKDTKRMAAGHKNWLEPQLVVDLTGEVCTMVSIGSSHCLACAEGGDCFVWGEGDVGQLGLGHFNGAPTICINNSFPAIKAVSAGANHSTALTDAGKLFTWGHAANGRLGVGAAERIGVPEAERFFFPVPTALPTLETIYQVSCGADYTLCRGASGVWAWGSGTGGKLGLGDEKDRYDPCLVPRIKGKIVTQIAASNWHSLAIVVYPPMLGGGMVYSWGSGYHGQLGQGTKNVSLYAEPVEYFQQVHLLVKFVAAGPFHCAAITREGELYTWGSNKYNCLGRKIDEKDVEFTPVPGHCGGFGAIVDRIGRGLPRYVACGREYTVVSTWPYEGPNIDVAKKLMEESRLREEEALLQQQHNAQYADESLG